MQKVEIKIDGCLDEKWVEWLDGFEISHSQQNETLLVGKVKDQAALYGAIAKLRDLGLKLISVNSKKRRERKTKNNR
jgi:uncharacterized DUF497 family protein